MALEIFLESNEKFSASSNKIKVNPGSVYSISSEVIGFNGVQYSAVFGVVLLDSNDNEIVRRIQWLNDFSGEKMLIKVVFKVPEKAVNAVIIYRINDEVPIKFECKYVVSPIENISLKEVNEDTKEEFEALDKFDFSKNLILKRPPELSEEEENNLEKNLVWIFASPRSGTRWLGTQLLNFNTTICKGPSIGLNLGLFNIDYLDDIIREIDLRGTEIDYFLSLPYQETWKYYLKKLILNRLFSQFQDLIKKIIISDPEGSLAADVISSTTPNSKIIVLIRDGRDVIDSTIDAMKNNSWFVNERKIKPLSQIERKPRITLQSKYWVKLMKILERTYEEHDEGRRLMIKYEDLRFNTLETLKKIYQFIDVKITDDDLKNLVDKYNFENIPKEKRGSGKVTRSASPGKWKESFNKEEINIMEKIMGNTLKKFNYKL